MRNIIGLILAAAIAGAVAVPALASTKTARVGDVFFSPGRLTIQHGTKVTWKFVGALSHTVSVKSGPVRFSSGQKSSGTYSHVFTRKGTYKLYCKVHPGQMSETLVVR